MGYVIETDADLTVDVLRLAELAKASRSVIPDLDEVLDFGGDWYWVLGAPDADRATQVINQALPDDRRKQAIVDLNAFLAGMSEALQLETLALHPADDGMLRVTGHGEGKLRGLDEQWEAAITGLVCSGTLDQRGEDGEQWVQALGSTLPIRRITFDLSEGQHLLRVPAAVAEMLEAGEVELVLAGTGLRVGTVSKDDLAA